MISTPPAIAHAPLLIPENTDEIRTRYGNPLIRQGEAPLSCLFVPLTFRGRPHGVISLQNLDRAHRMAARWKAGTVWINTYKQFSISTPFGGWRDSGLGREKGRLGIQQYMEQKSLYWGMNEHPLAWAN